MNNEGQQHLNSFMRSNADSHGGPTDEFRPKTWRNLHVVLSWWSPSPRIGGLVQVNPTAVSGRTNSRGSCQYKKTFKHPFDYFMKAQVTVPRKI